MLAIVAACGRVEELAPDATPTDVAPAVDAPVDGARVTSCLGIPPELAPAFADDFATLAGYTTVGGAWSVPAGELLQTDSTAAAALAFVTDPIVGVGNDYRVTVRARQGSGAVAGAIEVAFRKQQFSAEVVHCKVEPNTRKLAIIHSDVEGGDVPISPVTTMAAPADYDPMMMMTIEVAVTARTATCCIRELPGATVTTTTVPALSGPPGVRTSGMSAAFDELRVYVP